MPFIHVTAHKDDRHLDVVMAYAVHFSPEGKVIEFWTLSTDQKAVDEFIG